MKKRQKEALFQKNYNEIGSIFIDEKSILIENEKKIDLQKIESIIIYSNYYQNYKLLYPLHNICGIDYNTMKNSEEKDSNYHSSFVRLDNSSWKVIGSEKHADSIKQYAYFYMQCLKVSSKPYIDFIEKTLMDTISEMK